MNTFGLLFWNLYLSIKEQTKPWEFSVIRSLNLFAKGTKGLHKKMETVMAGCCVQVQCTFTWVKLITWQPLLKCWLSKWHACGTNLHTFVVPQLQLFGSCTLHLCVKRRRMSRILVFNDASAVFKIMQNVSTLQEFTACCLSRLDGRYTMTFNWYLKKEIKCLLSATAIWQKKKTKRCSELRVSYCF